MNRFVFFSAIISLIWFSSCKEHKQNVLVKFGGETQGTYYAVTYYSNDSLNLQTSVDSLLRRFDSTASTYKANSIISRLNTNDTSAEADEMFTIIFNRAIEISEKTAGAFDITVGPLVSAWGFGLSNRLKMDQQVVDSLLPLIGYKKIKLQDGKLLKTSPNMRIDFNAIAQGYAVDVVGSFLESKGIMSYLVDIGGEVKAKGAKPDGKLWNVAIEMPSKNADDSRSIQAVIPLKNRSISTSGSYRKFYEENGIRYSHTIDPSTGFPVKHSLLSVSVLSDDCMSADAYATALMVMGVDRGKVFLEQNPGLEAYFIYSTTTDSTAVYYTKGFTDLIQNDR